MWLATAVTQRQSETRSAKSTGLTVASSAAVKEVGPGFLAGSTLLQQELVGGHTVDPDMYSSVPVTCTERALSNVQSLQLHRPWRARQVSEIPLQRRRGQCYWLRMHQALLFCLSCAAFSLPCCFNIASEQQHAKRCTEAAPSLCTWSRCFTSPVFAPTSFSTCTGVQDHPYCSGSSCLVLG